MITNKYNNFRAGTQEIAPENAMGQYNRIADAILSLDIFPEKYGLFETELENSKRIRRKVIITH